MGRGLIAAGVILASLSWAALAQQPPGSGSFKAIEAKGVDFAGAPLFRKTARLKAESILIADKEQEVVTVVAGKPETKNRAKPGDVIVTGAAGERYVIAADRFPRLYEKDPANPEEYRAKGTVQAFLLEEGVTFKAPWGEQQSIEAGGVLVKNGEDVYGIQAGVFAETYGRADRSGTVFIGLDQPLAAQLVAASSRGEDAHVADLRRRMAR
ncbi:MAG: hypothetical protein HYR63_26980 [Proteobacteria bacterium]|nr:hypothetical protein [Pseudomonadota bacterium]MBI3498869.1 hypothetical protein [Pseudomonadota bacterium]